NLLYLLVSMLLGLVVVSGILSEQSIRGLRVEPLPTGELFAGRPALLAARILNRKRWRTSYSVTLEVADGGHRTHLPRLEAGRGRARRGAARARPRQGRLARRAPAPRRRLGRAVRPWRPRAARRRAGAADTRAHRARALRPGRGRRGAGARAPGRAGAGDRR